MPLQKGRLKRLTLRSVCRKKRRLTYSQRRSEGHRSWVLSWCSSRALETVGCSLFQGMAQPYLRSQINRWSPTTISQSLNPTTSSIKLLLIPNYSCVQMCLCVHISANWGTESWDSNWTSALSIAHFIARKEPKGQNSSNKRSLKAECKKSARRQKKRGIPIILRLDVLPYF